MLIIGLGNPGREYKNTRHNVGFETIDKLCYDYNIDLNKNKFNSTYGEGRIGFKKIMLQKPLTYMNLSGQAVRDIVNFYKIPLDEIIVVCDDINLPLGDIRIRTKGSDGGQKGLANIIYQLGSEDFIRIRIGVGNKPEGWELKNYVLSKFTEEEFDFMVSGITKATDAIELIVKDNDISKAMNLYNRKAKNA